MKFHLISALPVASVSAAPFALFMLGIFAVTPDVKGAVGAATIDIYEVGNDVFMTGSGTIDVTGLSIFNSTSGNAGMSASFNGGAFITLGVTPNVAYDRYSALSFPGPAGPGTGFHFPTSGSGARWGVYTDTVVLPSGASGFYDVGTSTDTYANETLATLGLSVGTYVWTLPTTNSTITVNVSNVPEPASAVLLFGGLGLLAVRRRRR